MVSQALAHTPETQENARLKNLEAQLEKKKAEVAAATAGDEQGEIVPAVESAKQELASLRRERDELSNVAGVAGQLSMLRRDADDKQEAASKSFEACGPRIAALFGAEVRGACFDARLKPLTAIIWQACDLKSFGDKIQSLLRTLQASGTAKEGEVRSQLNKVAALDSRATDSRTLASRLRDSLDAKRGNLVQGILQGAAWDSFEVRVFTHPSTCGFLIASPSLPGATWLVHEAAGGWDQGAGGDLRLENHHRLGDWQGAG